MTDTHDVLIDAAEELVKSEGLAALSMRSLASRTNYGKSTVHEALGSTDALIAELRIRAVDDMLGAAVGDLDPDPRSEVWRDGMYRRIAEWILSNAEWAEVCFRPEGAGRRWGEGVGAILLGVVPSGVAGLEPDERDGFSQLAVRTVGAVIPLVAATGDVEFGAAAVKTAMQAVYANLLQLVESRGLDTTPVDTTIRSS